MKKNKHTLKVLLLASIMAVAIATSPFAALAKENHKNYSVKSETELRTERNNNSVWNRIFAGLFNYQARAAAYVNTTPSISGITAPTALKTGQVGTWTVKASDPKNGSLSYAVDWGEADNNTLTRADRELVYVQTSTFTHAYAKAGTYTIKFTVSNEAGKSTTASTTVHVSGKPVTLAPVITGVTASSTKPHRAILEWNTDVNATSLVWYSKTSPVDTSREADISRDGKIKNHRLTLSKLDAETTYYVVVGSENKGGTTLSNEVSFTTTPEITKDSPVITSLTGSTQATVGAETSVTVHAYDRDNESLSYSADWGDTAYITRTALIARAQPVFVQSSTFSHIYTEAGTYTATFTVANSKGKQVSSSIKITVRDVNDTEAPVIASHPNIVVDATSAAGAVVTYTSPQVTDNVDANTTASCSPASGSVFPIGNTTVFCNYTDASGNKAVQTSFVVTVNPEL